MSKHSPNICPICGNFLRTQTYHDGFCMVEEYAECNRCNFYYEFCYGNYLEKFGKYKFMWSYSLYKNHNEAYTFEKTLHKAEFITGRNWRKGLRKNLKKDLDSYESY